MTAGPQLLRQAVDDAVAAGRPGAVAAAMARLWRYHGGATQAGFVLARAAALPPPLRRAEVAILRSYTVEPMVPVLRAAAAVRRLGLDVEVGGFNTYAQEILDPSSALHSQWRPDAIILATHTCDVAPELWWGEHDGSGYATVVDRVVDHLGGLVTTLRERSDAHLLLHDLASPPALALGLADERSTDGQAVAIDRVNAALGELAASIRGCHVVAAAGLAARHGGAATWDPAKWSSVRLPFTPDGIVDVADQWLRHLHPLTGAVAKVLAVDLDNTLWGGVIGEDGIDGIRLDPSSSGAPFVALQRALLALKARGVLLATCSKNNADDVAKVFEAHPSMLVRPGDFATQRVNWDDKATNLRRIAADLNIGIDAIAFLDDNPAEQAIVAELVPEVAVVPADADPWPYAQLVLADPRFERLALTDEDRARTDSYRRETARADLRASAADLETFLAGLGTSARIAAAVPADVERVAELTRKTNQFNLTTRRYSAQQVDAMMSDPSWRVYTVRAADRFGDHGLVGVALVEHTAGAWRIDTLLLSCRVIGRDIERALVHVVSRDARDGGVERLEGEFEPTAKNAPAAGFYEAAGFADAGRDGDRQRWSWELSGGLVEPPAWIEIVEGVP